MGTGMSCCLLVFNWMSILIILLFFEYVCIAASWLNFHRIWKNVFWICTSSFAGFESSRKISSMVSLSSLQCHWQGHEKQDARRERSAWSGNETCRKQRLACHLAAKLTDLFYMFCEVLIELLECPHIKPHDASLHNIWLHRTVPRHHTQHRIKQDATVQDKQTGHAWHAHECTG